MSTKAMPISQIKRRLEDKAGDLGGTRRYWDCVASLLDVAEAAQAVVRSWNSSTFKSDSPGYLQVNVDRGAWATFCELVEEKLPQELPDA